MADLKVQAVFLLICFVLPIITSAERTSVLDSMTVDRWINLLKYAGRSLMPEEKVPHEEHFDYEEHVALIATRIKKHFFNDHFEPTFENGKLKILTTRFATDFLIMLDSSSSIGTGNFQKAVKVLTGLVNMFDAKDFTDDTLRISMVSFSEPDKVVHHFPFTGELSKDQVIQKINETEYHNGTSTSTALGLWYADSIFTKSSRSSATRVILLATDGWSSETDLPFGVLWPAARLRKRLNVDIYALGIGDHINHNELKAIVGPSPDTHLFEISSYDMMADILSYLKELVASAWSSN